MTEKDRQIEFKVGDRVVNLEDGLKGTVTRLGRYEAVLVMWDGGQQEMVEVKTLRKEVENGLIIDSGEELEK